MNVQVCFKITRLIDKFLSVYILIISIILEEDGNNESMYYEAILQRLRFKKVGLCFCTGKLYHIYWY